VSIVAFASADWHVLERRDRGPWSGYPDVRGDDLYVLQQIANLCVEHDVPLFAAGDITDGPDPDPDTITALYTVLRPIRSVFYVLGNHERGRDWLAPLGPTAVRIDHAPVTIKSREAVFSVSGLSYVAPTEFPLRIQKVPNTDIGLFHQTWSELCGGGKTSLTALPDNRLSICGDVHVRKVLTVSRRLVVSPGPVSPQSSTEFMSPAVFAINDDLTVTEVPLVGRTFVAFEVNDLNTIDAVLSRIAGIRPTGDVGPPGRPMVSVRLGIGIDPIRFAAMVRDVNPDVCVRAVRVRNKETITRSDPGEYTPARTTGTSACVRLIRAITRDKSLTPAARSLATDMIESEDPDSVLSTHRVRHRQTDGSVSCEASAPLPCPISASLKVGESISPVV
jgi:hypothetical protein